jgi:hypothetical protein
MLRARCLKCISSWDVSAFYFQKSILSSDFSIHLGFQSFLANMHHKLDSDKSLAYFVFLKVYFFIPQSYAFVFYSIDWLETEPQHLVS